MPGRDTHCWMKDGCDMKNKSNMFDLRVGKFTIWVKPHSADMLISNSLIVSGYLYPETDSSSQLISGRLKSPVQHIIASGYLDTVSIM